MTVALRVIAGPKESHHCTRGPRQHTKMSDHTRILSTHGKGVCERREQPRGKPSRSDLAGTKTFLTSVMETKLSVPAFEISARRQESELRGYC